MLEINPIPAFSDNYFWSIENKDRQSIVVDPGDASPVLDHLTQNKLNLHAILITHHHTDHTGGVNALKKHFNCPVYGPKSEAIEFSDTQLEENDNIQFPDFELEFNIIDIPGHTSGHIAYVANGVIFCGDTLFSAGCGRLFEGSPQQMLNSLDKILKLPSSTKFYCAHEYTLNNLKFAQSIEPNNVDIENRIQQVKKMRKQNIPSIPTTLANEKTYNPFLRTREPNMIAAVAELTNGKINYDPVSIFTFLRESKDNF